MIYVFSKDTITGLIDLLVYFEVPEGKREKVKQRFKNIFLLSILNNT
jgi:hypothetical protein